MKKELVPFQAEISLRIRGDGFPPYERGLEITFLATNVTQAALDAMRFAQNRLKELPDLFEQVNAIHLHYFDPHVIAPDGTYDPARRGLLFEWKHDWPGTFEDYVKRINEHKAGISLRPEEEPVNKVPISCSPPLDFEQIFGTEKAAIDTYLDKNDYIEAIKHLRSTSPLCCGLREAKIVIDRYKEFRSSHKQLRPK